MDSFFKKNIAVAGAILLVVVAYIGNYLPLQKSMAFIDSNRSFGQITDLNKILELMARPLDLPSPIGQQELVRNTSNLIYNLVRSDNGKNPAITKALTDFVNKYYIPTLAKNRGLSFDQDLYILGLMNEGAAIQTRDGRYADAAQGYFERGLTLSPRRPQFLYGLFDVFRMKGDLPSAQKTGEKILSFWPADPKIKGLMDQINHVLSASATASSTLKR